MRSFLTSLVVLLSVVNVPAAVASPEGQMSFALQVSLAPVWFDPAETTSTSVPFIVLYAVHDALVKAMLGQPMAPSLAESWSVSRDGLAYEFVLRKGVGPAARPRQGHVRPDLGVPVDLRVRAASGGVGPGPDRQLPVLRPVRGSQAQSEVTIADMIFGS